MVGLSARISERRSMTKTINLLILFIVFALAAPVQADSGNPLPAKSDQWRFTVAFPMLWMPDINGKVRGGPDVDFKVRFGDILEDLSFGIMGELYANRGRFGAALRINYMNVKSEDTVDGLIIERVDTDLRMGVNDFLATWAVHEQVRLLAGVRHVHARLNLDLSTKIDPSGQPQSINVTDSNMYDFMVGLTYSHWFNQRWGLMLNADFSPAGDNDRDYSVEFRGLYRISDLNNFWFGYRYFNIGNDSSVSGNTLKVDMTQAGPMAGWAFTF